MKPKDDKNEKPQKITSKQVVALGGVVLLVLLYVITLIAAIADSSASGRLFALSLLASFAIPLLIWIYIWMYGKLTGRSTIADFKPEQKDSDDDA